MAGCVFHLDMDAYFAAIEQRDFPELRGRPVIVGGTGRRGVVSTASYEARKFGVHSAMPTYRARQLCPDGVFLPPRGRVYAEVSAQLMAILGRYSPAVEPLSLDEAFIDMSGSEALFGPPRAAAEKMRDDIERELQLVPSIGIASSKYVAKVASDLEKPRGLVEVAPGTERAFLAPLPIERLWGVGKKTAPKLHALGLRTIGDVAARDADEIERQLGALGAHIAALARGVDPRRVESEREEKSMSAERTFDRDIRGAEAVRDKVLPLVDLVAERLRRHGFVAGGVRLKVKYATFRSITRQRKLDEPASDGATIRAAALELLAKVDLEQPIRLVGLGGYALAPAAEATRPLFDERRARTERLEQALDAVNAKFGRGAVRRAYAERPGPGMVGRDDD